MDRQRKHPHGTVHIHQGGRAMKKLRIYLDTSIISYLDQQDTPEKMAITHKLWEKIKADEFEVVLSDVDFAEIDDCNDVKRAILYEYLSQIKYAKVLVDDKTMKVAERFVNLNILKQSSFDDCQHIAAAIVSGSDVIVSWNFKHIVNHKTMMGVKAVTALEGYDDLLIYEPTILLGGDEDDT
jgi:predicted nucleic acid-binding protein